MNAPVKCTVSSRNWGRPTLTAILAALLAGCGGGDSGNAPLPTAASTTVSGSVVKGPVAASQVCAFSVAGSARGTPLGSCTTTDANGSYSFAVPVGTGPLWVEATGGTYVDEVTGTTVTLPAGSPLVGLVSANGAAVTAMLTPLTTLALNAARTTVGNNGTLDANAYATAVAQLRTAFNLPSSLDISSTAPTFGAGINSYGTALTTISQMVANGLTLQNILATTQPSALATAYATAATPPTPPTSGGITATGTLTSDSALVETFVPRAAAGSTVAPFSTTVFAGNEQYTFANEIRGADATGNSAGVARQGITVTKSARGLQAILLEITFVRGLALSVIRECAAPCAGLTLVPSASGFGVSLNFSNVTFRTGSFNTLPDPPTTPVVINGSLAGEMPGGYVFVSQLPRGTTGTLLLDGVDVPVLYASSAYTSLDVVDRLLFPSVTVTTTRGTLTVAATTADGTTPIYNALFTTVPAGESLFLRVTADALTTSAGSFGINLAGATLTRTGSGLRTVVVDAALTAAKTTGTLTISGDGSFTAQTSTVSGTSQSITYAFDSPVPRGAPLAFARISITLKDGVVTSFTANPASGRTYTCADAGSMFMARCEGTVTVSADKRTLTFSGFKAGAQLSPNATVTFEGSLTASGL